MMFAEEHARNPTYGLHVHIYIYTYSYLHTYIYIERCIYRNIYIDIHIYIYTYIHIYIYIYIYIYVYTYTLEVQRLFFRGSFLEPPFSGKDYYLDMWVLPITRPHGPQCPRHIFSHHPALSKISATPNP